MSVKPRPNIEGTRHLMDPGPREPQGLHSACPTPGFSEPCNHHHPQPGQAARRLASPFLAPAHLGTCPNKSKHSRRLAQGGGGKVCAGCERGDTFLSPFTSVPSHRALSTRRPRNHSAFCSLASLGDQDHKVGVRETRKPGQTPINCWPNRTANN